MKSFTKNTLILTCMSVLALPGMFAKDVDEKFKQMDTNSDGQISRAEHAAGARQMFMECDSNHDGMVTAAEMSAKKETKADSSARESQSSRGDTKAEEMAATEAIKMMDKDADGQLTQAEQEAGSDAMFTKLDTNKDGSLSEQELSAGHKMMKKHK